MVHVCSHVLTIPQQSIVCNQSHNALKSQLKAHVWIWITGLWVFVYTPPTPVFPTPSPIKSAHISSQTKQDLLLLRSPFTSLRREISTRLLKWLLELYKVRFHVAVHVYNLIRSYSSLCYPLIWFSLLLLTQFSALWKQREENMHLFLPRVVGASRLVAQNIVRWVPMSSYNEFFIVLFTHT